jgi:hypothetical protein
MGGSAIVQVNRFPVQAAYRAAGAVIGITVRVHLIILL